jgi:hypothetical protein
LLVISIIIAVVHDNGRDPPWRFLGGRLIRGFCLWPRCATWHRGAETSHEAAEGALSQTVVPRAIIEIGKLSESAHSMLKNRQPASQPASQRASS